MTWDISDWDEITIKVNNGVQVYYIPKFRIYMDVTEPYLYLNWTDSEQGTGGGIRRLLEINYNDVSSLPASATALMATLNTMIVSAFGGGGGDQISPLLLMGG